MGTMENTPQTTFDLLADVRRRSEWDPMTDEAGIIETIDESTRVQVIYIFIYLLFFFNF